MQCINQTSRTSKALQIQIMDKIYTHSQICLIAAAGQTPYYGLPGVNRRARTPQARIPLGNLTLVQDCATGLNIAHSKWSSRAWTFQEGYLCSRRLVFTDEEVVFQCGQMYCQESRYWNGWTELEARSGMLRDDELSDVVPWPLETEEEGTRYSVRVRELLAQYSSRFMSFDADAINAFQGMFRYLGVRHCWGMPFVCPRTLLFTDHDGSGGMTVMLAWRAVAPRKRRLDFPSWSWASVEGSMVVDHINHVGPHGCEVEVAALEGQWMAVDEYFSSGEALADLKLSKLIRVTSYVSRPQFVSGKWVRRHVIDHFSPANEKVFAILKRGGESYRVFKVRADFDNVTVDSLSKAVTLFVAGSVFLHLLLLPVGSHFRRVGFVKTCEYGVLDNFTKGDLRQRVNGQRFLARTDVGFTEMSVRQTIILE